MNNDAGQLVSYSTLTSKVNWTHLLYYAWVLSFERSSESLEQLEKSIIIFKIINSKTLKWLILMESPKEREKKQQTIRFENANNIIIRM